jgi:hypothetical protein
MILLAFWKPIVYVFAALSAHRPLWEIFIIFMLASLIPNILAYYSVDIFRRIKDKLVKPKLKFKKGNGLRQKTHNAVWKWSQDFRMLPVILVFLAPIIPIMFFEQACLIVGRILKIHFLFFALVPVIQFFLIYFLHQQFF